VFNVDLLVEVPEGFVDFVIEAMTPEMAEDDL